MGPRHVSGAILVALLAPLPAQSGDRVSGLSNRDVRAAARSIDKLVDAALDQRQAKPNPRVSDEVFLRRIYLDVIGRIPTLSEFERFADSTNPAKREEGAFSL